MTNEAICIEAPKIIKRYTVANQTAIAYGTVLKLSGANTAATNSISGDVFAGIAIEEKTASDGITEIGAAIDGVWDILVQGGNITNGSIVCLSGANTIRFATEADCVLGTMVGKILETGTDATFVRTRLGLI